jgi:hypothetical protein
MEIDIDIEIDGAEAVGPAIEQGVESGIEETGNYLLRKGTERAKNIVLSAERVWRGTLREGFTAEGSNAPRYQWHGKIRNVAPHAELNEDGLKPNNSPEIQDILPWVSTTLIPNAEAQLRASESDIGNWDAELEALASSYSPAMVLTAFAVKGKLENKGYAGIHYMDRTDSYLQGIGPMILKKKVEKHIRKELQAVGS